MTRTVLELITDALLEIGVIGAGVPLADEVKDRALPHLQRMHDTMQADRLMLFTATRQTFALAANQQIRTMGDGGDFDSDAERPVFIEHVGIIPAGETHEVEVVPYVTRGEWLAERWKELTDLYPRRYLYEPTYPLGTFTFWPIQTSAPTIAITTATRLTAPAALDTDLVFPPGYHDAWHYNLAKRLQRPFRKPQDPSLADDALKALGVLKRLNDPGPPPAQFDGGLTGRGGFDIHANRYRP